MFFAVSDISKKNSLQQTAVQFVGVTLGEIFLADMGTKRRQNTPRISLDGMQVHSYTNDFDAVLHSN